jgi:hypothetical protein
MTISRVVATAMAVIKAMMALVETADTLALPDSVVSTSVTHALTDALEIAAATTIGCVLVADGAVVSDSLMATAAGVVVGVGLCLAATAAGVVMTLSLVDSTVLAVAAVVVAVMIAAVVVAMVVVPTIMMTMMPSVVVAVMVMMVIIAIMIQLLRLWLMSSSMVIAIIRILIVVQVLVILVVMMARCDMRQRGGRRWVMEMPKQLIRI